MAHGSGPAAELLHRALPALDTLPEGPILDLACGRGRNGLALARQGKVVWFVDRDRAALDAIQDTLEAERLPGVIWHQDLEQGTPSLGERRFAAILVFNYLFRPLMPVIEQALLPGGLLVYETFTLANREFGRPNNPHFLLKDNELSNTFASLQPLSYSEEVRSEPPRATAQLIARVPTDT